MHTPFILFYFFPTKIFFIPKYRTLFYFLAPPLQVPTSDFRNMPDREVSDRSDFNSSFAAGVDRSFGQSFYGSIFQSNSIFRSPSPEVWASSFTFSTGCSRSAADQHFSYYSRSTVILGSQADSQGRWVRCILSLQQTTGFLLYFSSSFGFWFFF